MAESIEDPWFQIQAYAAIASVCPENELKTYVARVEKVARGADDAFKTGALAWFIPVCLERGCKKDADRLAQVVVARASEIEPASSRAEALSMVWRALFPSDSAMVSRVLAALVEVGTAFDNWRGQRALRDVVTKLAPVDLEAARTVLNAMAPGNYKHQAERALLEKD